MKARLVREVARRNGPRQLRRALLAIGLVASAVGVSTLVAGPRVMKMFSDSKSEIARATVRKYVREGYPAWRAAHDKEFCPRSLAELHPYMSFRGDHDPWGVPYEMRCDDSGIVVHSLGADRTYDTVDDLWSFE